MIIDRGLFNGLECSVYIISLKDFVIRRNCYS